MTGLRLVKPARSAPAVRHDRVDIHHVLTTIALYVASTTAGLMLWAGLLRLVRWVWAL